MVFILQSHHNKGNYLQLLETLSPRVSRGGCIAWACVGADVTRGAFSNTVTAFDAVLHASLIHVAKVYVFYYLLKIKKICVFFRNQ